MLETTILPTPVAMPPTHQAQKRSQDLENLLEQYREKFGELK